MKTSTLLLTFLMIFSVMARSQFVDSDFENLKPIAMNSGEFIEMDFVWCDFDEEYTNVGGFREAFNTFTVATDVAGAGANGSTVVEVAYNIFNEDTITGYQMWSYPDMIDVSQFNFLVLNVFADMDIDSVQLVLLDDLNAHQDGRSQYKISIGTEWEQVVIPLDSFTLLTGWDTPADLTILHLIQVRFISDVVSESAASVFIDAVGFLTEEMNVATMELNAIAVNVYPNPARNLVNITAKAGSQISLLNLNGCTISSKIADGPTTSFSLSDLPQGVYFVRVTDNNINVVRKVLLQ